MNEKKVREAIEYLSGYIQSNINLMGKIEGIVWIGEEPCKTAIEALEKILEEINEKIKFAERMVVEEPCDKLDEIPNCEGCSRRKWYQKGFEDGKKDNDWIPVEERMPKELERVIAWDRYRKRTIIVRYACGAFVYNYYTEPLDIIAWQPLPEPYKGGEE